MKKSILTVLFILSVVLLSCENESILSLKNDKQNDEINYEIDFLVSDKDIVLNEGFDSTYFFPQNRRYFENKDGYIYAAKIKNEIKTGQASYFRNIDIFEAQFFDKNKEILNSQGEFLGYFSVPIGEVRINNVSAQQLSKISFVRKNGKRYEIKTGVKYFLYKGPKIEIGENFYLNYGALLNLNVIRANGTFRIEYNNFVPEEINANLKLNYSSAKILESVEISWNKSRSIESNLRQKIEIIVGKYSKSSHSTVPIFKVTTQDCGTIKLPARLFSNLKLDEANEEIIFSILKKNLKYAKVDEKFQNIDFIAASVHNIRIQKFY